MQISRHWRLNAKRYRLEGVRYETGELSLQERPITLPSVDRKLLDDRAENNEIKESAI